MNKKLTINSENSESRNPFGEIASKSKNIKAMLKSKYLVYKLQRDFFYKKFD